MGISSDEAALGSQSCVGVPVSGGPSVLCSLGKTLALQLSSCVTMAKLLNLPVSCFHNL